MDREVIEHKLESLRRCLQRVAEKCPSDPRKLGQDPDLQDIVTFNLSRAVQSCVDLKKLRHHRLAFFAYPLSDGFDHPSLMPTWMMRPVLTFERVLGLLSRYLAFRILVVLEKGAR